MKKLWEILRHTNINVDLLKVTESLTTDADLKIKLGNKLTYYKPMDGSRDVVQHQLYSKNWK